MPSDVSLLATQIFARSLTPLNAAEFLAETTEDQRGVIEDQLPSPAPNTFDAVRAVSTAILNNEFAEFKRTPEFNALNDILNKNVVEDKRDIDQFERQSRREAVREGTTRTRVQEERDAGSCGAMVCMTLVRSLFRLVCPRPHLCPVVFASDLVSAVHDQSEGQQEESRSAAAQEKKRAHHRP